MVNIKTGKTKLGILPTTSMEDLVVSEDPRDMAINEIRVYNCLVMTS